MDPRYKGLRWTNHAMERMRQRGISQGDAWATWNRPDQSRKNSTGKMNGAWVYYRTWGNQKIEVVATQDERKDWIILSVWSNPVYTPNSLNSPNHPKSSFWANLSRILFGK